MPWRPATGAVRAARAGVLGAGCAGRVYQAIRAGRPARAVPASDAARPALAGRASAGSLARAPRCRCTPPPRPRSSVGRTSVRPCRVGRCDPSTVARSTRPRPAGNPTDGGLHPYRARRPAPGSGTGRRDRARRLPGPGRAAPCSPGLQAGQADDRSAGPRPRTVPSPWPASVLSHTNGPRGHDRRPASQTARTHRRNVAPP